MPNPSMIAMLEEEEIALQGGADRSIEFEYLAGPMTGIPSNNFPAFNKAVKKLRDAGHNILNPAELGPEQERLAAIRSKDGTDRGEIYGDLWKNCLRRDIDIVMDPNCVGVICIDGWEHSRGAQVETYNAIKFDKPIRLMVETDNGFELVPIKSRRAALDAAGVEDD